MKVLIALFLAAAGMVGMLLHQTGPVAAQAANVNIFGAQVLDFTPGLYTVDGAGCAPNNQNGTGSAVLGAPDDPAADGSQAATSASTSLGNGGSITIQFSSPASGDGDTSTPDVWVWETGGVAEAYRVQVSTDNLAWVTVGDSDQSTIGSQGFDVDHAGFTTSSRLPYIRVTDLNPNPAQTECTPSNTNAEGLVVLGSDIDAVGVVTPALNPALELSKTNDVTDPSTLAVGDVVTYTFTATNTGNADLTDVTVTDNHAGLSSITPASADIAAGASATFTATYTVTQDDFNAGVIDNTATVTGTPPADYSGDPPTATDDNEIVLPRTPGLSITKTADPTTGLVAGDTVTYTFAVTNTGNVTITNATLDDDLGSLNWVTGPNIGTILPGQTVNGTATYVVTQDNVDAGLIHNYATVTGTPPDGLVLPTPPGSSVDIPLTQNPAITLEKTADTAGPVAVGDTITYTFTATNSGTVTLGDVTVTDALPGLTWVTGPNLGTIAPGDSATGTATYVVTDADAAAGSVDNSATATGTPPDSYQGDPPVSPPSDVNIPVGTPGLTLTKTADTAGPVAVGDVITYTFTAENTGNLPLTDVTVTDGHAGLTWVTGPDLGDLAPGDTATGTATYVVTDADAVAGSVDNSATATGTPPADWDGTPPTTPPSDVHIPTDPIGPGVTLVKSADTDGPVAVGDTITYSFVVTNSGNATLTDVTVTDALPGLTWVTGPDLGTLAPGDSATGTATYVVTQADVDAGGVNNSATATGLPPDGYQGDPPVSPPSDVNIPTGQPGVTLTKTADTAGPVKAGDTITYTFTAENTGSLPLTDVTVTDTLAGLTWITGPDLGDLTPGESATGTATYIVTQADVDAGSVTNSATATGTPPDSYQGDPPVSPPSSVNVPTDPGMSGLQLIKTANPDTTVTAGDIITYTFTVTNIGTVPVDNVTVTDALAGLSAIDGPQGTTLQPGEATTFTAQYTVTAADVAAGVVANNATATGTGPSGEPISSTDGVQVRACATGAQPNVPSETVPTATVTVGAAAATPIVLTPAPTATLVDCAPLTEPTPTTAPVQPTQDPGNHSNPGNPGDGSTGGSTGGNAGGGTVSGGSGNGGGVTVKALPNTGQGQASTGTTATLLAMLAAVGALVATLVLAVAMRYRTRTDN